MLSKDCMKKHTKKTSYRGQCWIFCINILCSSLYISLSSLIIHNHVHHVLFVPDSKYKTIPFSIYRLKRKRRVTIRRKDKKLLNCLFVVNSTKVLSSLQVAYETSKSPEAFAVWSQKNCSSRSLFSLKTVPMWICKSTNQTLTWCKNTPFQVQVTNDMAKFNQYSPISLEETPNKEVVAFCIYCGHFLFIVKICLILSNLYFLLLISSENFCGLLTRLVFIKVLIDFQLKKHEEKSYIYKALKYFNKSHLQICSIASKYSKKMQRRCW